MSAPALSPPPLPPSAPQDLPARLLLRWTRLLARHRLLLSILLILQAILFSWLSAGIRWQPDILQFFSGNSAAVRDIRAASQQPGLATQLRIDLHADTPAHNDAVLPAAADLADRLRASNEFRTVWTGIDTAQMATAYQHLLQQAPALLTPAEQHEIESHATDSFLTHRLADAKAKLADPDGELVLQQVRNDPLNLSSIVSTRLRQLSPVRTNTSTDMQDGILTTRDSVGRLHAMIVTEPWSLPSNQKAAEQTLQTVNTAIAATRTAHPNLSTWVVGAHRGYVENTQRVITDVTWVSILGSLAVALAIALYFRRISTALLCIIPASIGIGITLGFSGIIHIQLPLILLGFAGLLCGSTTDYGIQIIAEIRRLARANNNTFHPDLPAIAARRLLGPISMSVATSVTGFAALGLSDSPGLRALGLFVAAATICIWIITFLILPAYLAFGVPRFGVPPLGGSVSQPCTNPPKGGTPNLIRSHRLLWWGGCLLFLAATALLTRYALHVRFNSDPRALDGSSRQLLSDEHHFFQTWGNLRDRAIVLARAPSPADALTLADHLNAYLHDLQRDHQIDAIISPAPILPDNATVTQNLAAWQSYWTPAHRNALRSALTTAAQSTGFKPAFFTLYADRLTDIHLPPAPDRLAQSPAALFPGFIDTPPPSSPGNTTIAAIVQMRTDTSLRLETGWGQELRLRFPHAIILSGQMLAFDATQRARAEGERLAPICFLVILFPLWLYFRNLRRAWLAMLCLIVGFLWVLGAAQLFAGGLNLLSLVPILFTLGVAVDYGIYAASDPALRTKDSALRTHDSRLSATFLCATTTLLGSGSLILASHPALHWLGITLVAGLAGGDRPTRVLVAPLSNLKSQNLKFPRPSVFIRLCNLALTLPLLLLLLTILITIPVLAEWQLAHEHPAGAAPAKPIPVTQIAPRTYTAANSWMRWRPTSPTAGFWELKITGTPEQRGRALSALASPIDVRIENDMLDQFDHLVPDEWARWLLLRTVGTNLVSLPSYIPPEYQREIYAAATSYPDPHAYLAPAYPRILSYHALHDVSQMLIDNPLIVPNQFACTGLISLPSYTGDQSSGGGENGRGLMLGRVFDFEGGDSFSRQKSLTYIFPPPGHGIPFAHVAWPGLAGCVTGINADRLALFINAAATSDYRRIGTPTILMACQVLEHAHTLDDAEKIIRNTPVFVSDILVVADGKIGQARIFEKSPRATASYDVHDSAVVTNHLLTPTFAGDPVNRERIADSTTTQRYNRARQLLDRIAHHVTVPALISILRDKKAVNDKDIGYGNRNAIDGLIACHAVVFDVTRGQLWVGGYPHCEGAFVGIDILKMLQNPDEPPNTVADASPSTVPEDTIMTDGTWERILASQSAERDGLAAFHVGNLSQAEALARQVIAANPNFYFGHELLGRTLLKRGDKSAAKTELAAALQLDPPYAQRRHEIEGLLKQCDVH